jgi:hypothetical protein
MLIQSCGASYHLETLQRVPINHKALARGSPLALDFPGSRTVRNRFLYKFPRLWYSITMMENRLKYFMCTSKFERHCPKKIDVSLKGIQLIED